jgi:hypothetical protein
LLIGVWKDRYIFGHPRTFFDSPKKFSVHFKWLMQGGIGKCGCRNCKGPIMRNSSLPVAVPAAIASDPDINDLGAQLERLANYFEQNPDDMSEHIIAWEGPPPLGPHELLDGQSFQNLPTKYQTLPSFLPRKGELVIFYLEEELDCRFEEISQQFRVFNEASGEFLGFPTWRAGVIVAEPENKLGHEDLSTQPYDQLEATKKLFRIELYPDPESGDKSLSSKSYDSPLSRIRPLSLFHEFLSGVAQMEWHETIHNALKSMNTVCVVEPIEFAGKWFSYSIRCRGIWIGPELYVNGDAVRLLPARGNGTEVDQIMTMFEMSVHLLLLRARSLPSTKTDHLKIRPSLSPRNKSCYFQPALLGIHGIRPTCLLMDIPRNLTMKGFSMIGKRSLCHTLLAVFTIWRQ